MIYSSIELILADRDDVRRQVNESGYVRWAAETQQGCEVGVEFPDFETARTFFGCLVGQIVDFDVRWMVQRQTPVP